MNKKGVLLVNVGTPDSPSTPDVRKYLNEFLMDKRVIDVHPIWRTILVKAIITPFRAPKSAALYQEIWSEKTGSPLLHYSLLQADLLQKCLGAEYRVELAMRYQQPSMEAALKRLQDAQVNSIHIIPMFPQYASASTGTVMEKAMDIIGQWPAIPNLSSVSSFHNHPLMIHTFADNARKHLPETYDHVLFSFHGLPERQLKKADHSGEYCLKNATCCQTLTTANQFCYSAQSHDTARLIAQELQLKPSQYTVCFQSRLGSDPWVKPYTVQVLEALAKKGIKRVLVLCPAFVADCLETIYEISVEYNELFKSLGGEHVQLVESLNDHPQWIATLKDLVIGH